MYVYIHLNSHHTVIHTPLAHAPQKAFYIAAVVEEDAERMWRIPLYPLTGNTEHARIEIGSQANKC